MPRVDGKDELRMRAEGEANFVIAVRGLVRVGKIIFKRVIEMARIVGQHFLEIDGRVAVQLVEGVFQGKDDPAQFFLIFLLFKPGDDLIRLTVRLFL